MATLFTNLARNSRAAPLADRIRPTTLEDFVGQEHIIGKGKLLRNALEDPVQMDVAIDQRRPERARLPAGVTLAFVRLTKVDLFTCRTPEDHVRKSSPRSDLSGTTTDGYRHRNSNVVL